MRTDLIRALRWSLWLAVGLGACLPDDPNAGGGPVPPALPVAGAPSLQPPAPAPPVTPPPPAMVPQAPVPAAVAGSMASPPVAAPPAPPPAPAKPRPRPLSPTFDNVYYLMTSNLMPDTAMAATAPASAGCTCHLTGEGAGNLAMPDKEKAWENLVGKMSSACVGIFRVAPGMPENSVLLHSLDHTMVNGCVAPPMPAGLAIWSAEDIAVIKQWIQLGALNN